MNLLHLFIALVCIMSVGKIIWFLIESVINEFEHLSEDKKNKR